MLWSYAVFWKTVEQFEIKYSLKLHSFPKEIGLGSKGGKVIKMKCVVKMLHGNLLISKVIKIKVLKCEKVGVLMLMFQVTISVVFPHLGFVKFEVFM